MKCQYFEKWVRMRKSPIGPLTEAEAAVRHEAKKPYVVVASDDGNNHYVLELPGTWIVVMFLDESKRPYLQYEFTKQASGRHFLGMSTHREYDGGSDEITKSTTFKFTPGGKMEIFVVD